MASSQLHVIFGAGQIGPFVARGLAARGHTVRIVRRSAATAIDGIQVSSGDAGDAAFAAEATHGAVAIYHCMNPAYSTPVWNEQLPRIARSLIAAAGQNGARLVVLDNLYMLGRPTGPINEDSPQNPSSKKGEIRARVAEMLFDAHRRGVARVVTGRGADFYGPGGRQSYFGDAFWPRVFAGKKAQLIVNPEMPHTYHFTRDVAAGLVALGEAPDEAYGRWWMLPCSPAISTREMVKLLAAALGRDLPTERVPRLMLAALGLFVPIVKELGEMQYQWEVPFVCDDRRFRERFGVKPTAYADGAQETVTWAQATYGATAWIG